jgi:hypothetical protein
MIMMPHGKTLAYRCSSQGMQTSGTPQDLGIGHDLTGTPQMRVLVRDLPLGGIEGTAYAASITIWLWWVCGGVIPSLLNSSLLSCRPSASRAARPAS